MKEHSNQYLLNIGQKTVYTYFMKYSQKTYFPSFISYLHSYQNSRILQNQKKFIQKSTSNRNNNNFIIYLKFLI